MQEHALSSLKAMSIDGLTQAACRKHAPVVFASLAEAWPQSLYLQQVAGQDERDRALALKLVHAPAITAYCSTLVSPADATATGVTTTVPAAPAIASSTGQKPARKLSDKPNSSTAQLLEKLRAALMSAPPVADNSEDEEDEDADLQHAPWNDDDDDSDDIPIAFGMFFVSFVASLF